MKRTMTLLAGLLFAGSLLAAPAPTTWTVDSNTSRPADFRTLQDAHDGAQPGDVLHVIASSVNYGELIMTKPLTIIGPGYLLNQNLNFTVAAPSAITGGITCDVGSTGSLVTGLEIIGNAYFVDSNLTFKRNFLRGSVTNGGTTNCSNLMILQNLIHGYVNFTGGANSAVVIRGNYVDRAINLYDLADSGIIEHNVIREIISANAIVRNNICESAIYGYGTADLRNNWASSFVNYSGLPTIENNSVWTTEITFAGQFVGTGSLDARWQLKTGEPGSAVFGTGLDGADPGMFSGPDPYVLSGLPSVPLVIGIQAPSSASAASGLPVSVTIQVSPPMSAPMANQAPAK